MGIIIVAAGFGEPAFGQRPVVMRAPFRRRFLVPGPENSAVTCPDA
jgi:hypothetical protein